MQSPSDNLKRLLPWLAAELGAALTVLCFYPGYMSLDSFDQLLQARSGGYTNWHPPLMAWIWSFLDKVIPGPFGILLFFVAMFWTGLALFTTAKVRNAYLAAGVILAAGMFPAVFALLGTAWKDVGMGAALVLSAGLIARASQDKSLKLLALAAPSLFFAYASRHEAGFAVFPLLLWAAGVGLQIRTPLLRPKGSAVALAALAGFVGLYGLNHLVQYSLLKKKPTSSPIQITWVQDLIGLSLDAPTPALPQYLTAQDPEFNFEELKKIYDPSSPLRLFKDEGIRKKLPVAKTREEFQSLFEYWFREVRRQPWQYLKQRWAFFLSSLSIQKKLVYFPYQAGISENSLGISLPETRLNSAVMAALSRIRNSWVFRAWVYLAFSIVLLAAGIALRSLEIVAISASALLYEGIHFFTLSACDFRYHWWTVLSVLLCLIALAAQTTPRARLPIWSEN